MCQEIFFIILATAISGIPMSEIASYRGSWGERSCPRGAAVLHSVSVNWTHNHSIERRNSTTWLSPPQRNLLRQCLGVRWCYNVPLRSYWGTNDRRWKVKLALTIYRDFMQNLFIRFWEEGQYQPRTTAALMFASPQSNVISLFVQRTLDWAGRNCIAWRGRCRDFGTIATQLTG